MLERLSQLPRDIYKNGKGYGLLIALAVIFGAIIEDRILGNINKYIDSIDVGIIKTMAGTAVGWLFSSPFSFTVALFVMTLLLIISHAYWTTRNSVIPHKKSTGKSAIESNILEGNRKYLANDRIPIIDKTMRLDSLSDGRSYIDFTFQFINSTGSDIVLTSKSKIKGLIKYNNTDFDLVAIFRIDENLLDSNIHNGDIFSIDMRQYISITISDEIRKRPDRLPIYFVRKFEFDFRNVNIPIKISDIDIGGTEPRLNLGIEKFLLPLGGN